MTRARRRANGEGTVTKRKDGRWEGAAYVPCSDGTTKRKRVYGRTREEAHGELVKLLVRANDGVPVARDSWLLRDYLDYWLDHVVAVRRRPGTYAAYESPIRLYITPFIGGKRLEKLTPQDVRGLLARCRKVCLCCSRKWDVRRPEADQCCSQDRCCERRLSARMLQVVHAVLRAALQNAVREEIVTRNVAKLVQVSGPTYARGKGLTPEQARDLLRLLEGDRFRALYLLALTLGLRRGELLGLSWDALDLEGHTLSVRRSVQRVRGELIVAEPKTRHSLRMIPLPAFVVDSLRERQKEQQAEQEACGKEWLDTGFVFTTAVGSVLDPRNLSRHWFALRKRAALDDLRFHDLRHTCASLLLDMGTPPHAVREILGHSAIEITMGVYAHASSAEKLKALDALGKKIKP